MVGGDCGGGNYRGTDCDDGDHCWLGHFMVIGMWEGE
jgi:hypothetical protein